MLLTETRYAAGARIPRHRHERGYFCLVRRGQYREEFCGGHRLCGPQTLAYHPPGEWHAEEFERGETSKTITIVVKGDNKKEANETFFVDLFGLSGNALFIKSRGIGTILNDD